MSSVIEFVKAVAWPSIARLIELLKVLTWPAVVVWLIWYLRDEVKRAAARIIELGLTGAKFAPPPPPEQVPPPSPASPLPTPGDSAQSGALAASDRTQQFIAEIKSRVSEDQLRSSVQALREQLPSRTGTDPKQQVEGLIYFAASLAIQLGHEQVYRSIYGSQLEALAQMIPAGGAPPNVAKDIYERAKASFPDAYRSYTFEQWIRFLFQTGLCQIGPNGDYVLTPYGRGFLKYIVDAHLPPNKPF
jgi:hypothetical protein